MADVIAFSVDLEPNKDGTLHGIRDAMEWFDRTIPKGTVFATYRIATEMPDLLAELAESHEIGVHVHPREFGHEHDQLAELAPETQRGVIETTRTAITDATGTVAESFRAGRHSVSLETLSVIADLNFSVDASVNIRYDEYLPSDVTHQNEPFEITGLTELPVTYGNLPILSRCGIRALTERPMTATAATIRADRLGCSGETSIQTLISKPNAASFYMHPYDATEHHDLENSGEPFRHRVNGLVEYLMANETEFVEVGLFANS